MKTAILPDGSAFCTAIIMSKDEAMKLPAKDRPVCFRLSSEMYHAVWESIGAASMTFNKDAGNEVFNAEQASKIAMDLLFKIANEVEQAKLDAMKEGARRAARECKPENENYCGGSTGNARRTSNQIKQAIISTSEAWTEKDL